MEAFNIIKTVIINNRQDESQACYWDLYISNTPTVAKRADKAATNYHAAGLEESLECLRVQMQALQYAGMKYFIVVLKTSANAPQGNPIPAPNDAYKGYTPGIGSVNNMQQTQQNQLLALQQQMHQMQIEHIREMNRIEMERLKEDLEGALNHKEKAIDKFLDFLDKPAFQPVIAGLVQRMAGAPVATPSIANTPPTAPTPAAIEQNVADNATDIDTDQEQQMQQAMAESMYKIDRVFPGETLAFIQELAAYVEANPELAQSYRQMIKTAQNA